MEQALLSSFSAQYWELQSSVGLFITLWWVCLLFCCCLLLCSLPFLLFSLTSSPQVILSSGISGVASAEMGGESLVMGRLVWKMTVQDFVNSEGIIRVDSHEMSGWRSSVDNGLFDETHRQHYISLEFFFFSAKIDAPNVSAPSED